MVTQVRIAHPEILPVQIGRVPEKEALELLRGGRMLVIDDAPWTADFDVLRAALEPKRHVFGEKFWGEQPDEETTAEIGVLIKEATGLLNQICPSFRVDELARRMFPDGRSDFRKSWRPLVTGPEPMHFDSYPGPSLVTAYLNVSDRTRVYRLSYSFKQLLALFGERMRYIWKKTGHLEDLAYELRVRDDSPLIGAPFIEVHLAPKSIWFFDAKTVSHQVIFGTGVLGLAWECAAAGLETQAMLMQRAFRGR